LRPSGLAGSIPAVGVHVIELAKSHCVGQISLKQKEAYKRNLGVFWFLQWAFFDFKKNGKN
ncbi:MAG: hypothetical protein AABX93_02625, partial [Nanoarchaeota archaeon]